jgi:RNA polymerase sigma-70 factor (ECF subfamily)
MPDSELVKRVLTGDVHAFGLLVEKYKDAVYGAILSRIKNFADADDIAQEAFLKAYRNLSQLKNPSKFGNWLYSIALNACTDWMRKLREKPTSPLEPNSEHSRLIDPSQSPEKDYEEEQIRVFVLNAISSLSDVNREAITLYYINGYSQDDISEFLDVPLGTVKRRLHDAREQLKKEVLQMVEDTLKGEKPGDEFTKKVLDEIKAVSMFVGVDPMIDPSIVLLTDDKGRSMPIWIGIGEAFSINLVLEGKTPPRPLTHDLFINTLRKFGIELSKVVVSDLREGTFYATITFERYGVKEEVDARPSDAIALAVRVKAPIFASEDVLQECMAKDNEGKPVSLEEAKERYKDETNLGKKIDDLKKEIEEKPNSVDLHCTLGDFYIKKSRFNKEILDVAMSEFSKALELGAEGDFKFISHNRLGIIYLKKGMLKEALEEEEKALKVDPNGWEAHFTLSAIYAEKENKGKAIESLEKFSGFVGEKGRPISTKPLEFGHWSIVQQEFKKMQEDERFQKVCSKLGSLGAAIQGQRPFELIVTATKKLT